MRADARGIFGHSMGGHGALALALRNPDRYRSVSAFAPDRRAVAGALGQKAFAGYSAPTATRGPSTTPASWCGARPLPGRCSIDQGTADKFLDDAAPAASCFEAACAGAGQPLELRQREGYDHSYYFIADLRRGPPRAPRRALL